MTLGRNMSVRPPNEAYKINFGDCAENEDGMKPIGTRAQSGMSISALEAIASKCEESTVIDLSLLLGANTSGLPHPHPPEAAVLIVRGGVQKLLGDGAVEAIYKEMRSMPKDTTLFCNGKVMNKRARYNLCIGDVSQTADIPNGLGTVVRFSDYPHTNSLRKKLEEVTETETQFVADVDHFYDADKCGIGWHGNRERRVVIGAHFGQGAKGMPLKIQWFFQNQHVGEEARIELNPGDLYVLSDKAVGNDWTTHSTLTLRHAVGKDTCEYSRSRGLKRQRTTDEPCDRRP